MDGAVRLSPGVGYDFERNLILVNDPDTKKLLKLSLEGYCQVGESRLNIVGLKDAPSTISWGRIGLEALNLTIPS